MYLFWWHRFSNCFLEKNTLVIDCLSIFKLTLFILWLTCKSSGPWTLKICIHFLLVFSIFAVKYDNCESFLKILDLFFLISRFDYFCLLFIFHILVTSYSESSGILLLETFPVFFVNLLPTISPLYFLIISLVKYYLHSALPGLIFHFLDLPLLFKYLCLFFLLSENLLSSVFQNFKWF